MKTGLCKIPYVALSILLLFCCAVLSAQAITLNQPVTALSINADDSILAAAGADSLSVYETSSYSCISTIEEKSINHSRFYRVLNGELLVILTDTEKFLLYRRSADSGKTYNQTEAYTLSDYTEGKTIDCAAFSNNTNYIAAAGKDFSIQLHFKLRFTQEMITRTLDGHHAEIYGLAFSDDEKYLVSVSKDGETLLWDCATYTQAAKLDDVYTGSNIPAIFTADNRCIISMESESSVRLSAITGQKILSIDIGSIIRALSALPDPDKIAVLNDKNEIVIYSIKLQKSIDIIRLPESETSDITAFNFCHTENAAFVGCKSGAVYKLKFEDNPLQSEPQKQEMLHSSQSRDNQDSKPSENTEEEQSKVQDADADKPQSAEEDADTDKPFKPALKTEKNHFLTISVLTGFLQPEKTNFRYLFGVDVCYRNTYLTAPVYIGAGLRAHVALPKRNFPSHYEDFNGKTIAPPLLWIGEVYVPAGIEVVLDRRGYAVLFEEIALTARLSALNRPKIASSKPFFSYGGRFTTGIMVKFFTFAAALNYDSLWKLFPEISIGGRIDFKSFSKTKKEAL